MNTYETVLIARQDLTEAQFQELIKEYSDLLTADGGKVLKTEIWGLRTLAYRINKNRKGHYVLIETQTTPAALHEAERRMRLSEDILRYMTIKLDQPSEGPSPLAADTKEAA